MNTYDLGTGFSAGLQQGMALGMRRKEMEQARAQQLADEARRQQILDSQRAQQLLLESRRFAAAHPEAALAEVGALRQQGPLTQDAALMEGIAQPLAFANYQDKQAATVSAQELMAMRRQQTAADIAAQQARVMAIREDIKNQRAANTARTVADAAGTFVGSAVERSPVAQLAGAVLRNRNSFPAAARPQADTVEETWTDENGKTFKVTRKVPAGATASPSAASPGGRVAVNPMVATYLGLAGEGQQQTEAQKKKIEEDRKALEDQAAEKMRANRSFGNWAGADLDVSPPTPPPTEAEIQQSLRRRAEAQLRSDASRGGYRWPQDFPDAEERILMEMKKLSPKK